MIPDKHTVLIIGGNGYIGNAIYSELRSYFEIYGTYNSASDFYNQNQVFFKYNAETDDIASILEITQPTVIVSACFGNFSALKTAHKKIAAYVNEHHHCRLFFLSCAAVFDGLYKYPSFEKDTTKSESDLGNYKISVEKMLLENIPAQVAILRLPMVLGVTSPMINHLRQCIKTKATFEVFPNKIINLTTADKIAQQVHYLIAKNADGIYHLGSTDVIHHNDLFAEICEKMGDEYPVFKNVYNRNEDTYAAVLPKHNTLPKQYQIDVATVINDCVLNEEIVSLKQH